MNSREEYDAAFKIVGDVVRAWDPYSLIGNGAPADEFDAEIGRLVSRIPHITSSFAAAAVISEVFSASFEPGLFSPEQCAVPGQKLFAGLSAAGLAPQS